MMSFTVSQKFINFLFLLLFHPDLILFLSAVPDDIRSVRGRIDPAKSKTEHLLYLQLGKHHKIEFFKNRPPSKSSSSSRKTDRFRFTGKNDSSRLGQDRERDNSPKSLVFFRMSRQHPAGITKRIWSCAYKDRRDFLHLKMHSADCSGKNILHPSQ